jgi:hypothetical protein
MMQKQRKDDRERGGEGGRETTMLRTTAMEAQKLINYYFI